MSASTQATIPPTVGAPKERRSILARILKWTLIDVLAAMVCRMEAIYEDAALMEVVFDGHFLIDWREMVTGARRLVKSFETH